ncbi:hypothetical protein [Amycolatopsis sp. NPDC051071]
MRKWTADGTWDRILEHVIVKDDSLGTLENNVALAGNASGAPGD